ncbi:MAG: type III-B CRISPR module-associated protein Cmr5 [Calditrichaeota bacterium]|nr:type III-B CRISPR module-associated protein Cmr5 [Calditrichota bacterium]MCB0291973.1 type III-B CRISPR module-associated protein Cmr5 [Calditrichota bacterium]MCB0297693.1 type III-B CRISPR module-associated protein Cmr5 [Calditrichota bacterium]MCB0304377.1 type III-B CRISPR module-associated protein Cmr5 [Calditrichota bacterium]MCB0316036.1 type III-B CRISPR module-associated protein Cmr5 [Calditrichota bacterium]
MINLDQVRAQRAFDKATHVSSPNSGIDSKEYLGLARSLPAMFQNNGLLATWAFMLSKKDKNHFNALLKALLDHFRDPQINLGTSQADVVRVFTDDWTGPQPLDGTQLMRLTSEAIAFSGWLKRAAEALCDK